jgi:hypothetical protein
VVGEAAGGADQEAVVAAIYEYSRYFWSCGNSSLTMWSGCESGLGYH